MDDRHESVDSERENQSADGGTSEPKAQSSQESKAAEKEQKEDRKGDQQLEEPSGGDAGEGKDAETEEDEPEGLMKSIKKGCKSVKRYLTGSTAQGKGDNPETVPQPSSQHGHPSQRANSDEYDFTHRKRGLAIIINNEKFRRGSMLDSRPGSGQDLQFLKEVFQKLKFDIKCFDNLTAMEVKQTLEKEAHLYDHHNADCVAVAILSHGDSELQNKAYSYYQQKVKLRHLKDKVRRDILFGVDGSHISTASIIRTFQDDRCPGLCGKPRLFFLQACRGDEYDDGLEVKVTPDRVAADTDEEDEIEETEETDARGAQPQLRKAIVSPAPIFKDFLVMYATTPGHFAWRRPSGTWFIKSLHSVFTQQLTPNMSLTQALTRVSGIVAREFQSNNKDINLHGKKQTPVMESMLVKEVFFTEK